MTSIIDLKMIKKDVAAGEKIYLSAVTDTDAISIIIPDYDAKMIDSFVSHFDLIHNCFNNSTFYLFIPNDKSFNGNLDAFYGMDVHLKILNQTEIQYLLKYFVMDYNNHFILSLDKPHGRHFDRLVALSDVSYDDIICHAIFKINERW